MFKSRNFLMGIGFGLILSSIVLILIGGQLPNQLVVYNKHWTVSELKELATQQDVYLYTKAELEHLKKEIEEGIKGDQTPNQDNNSGTTTEDNSNTLKTTEDNTKESGNNNSEESNSTEKDATSNNNTDSSLEEQTTGIIIDVNIPYGLDSFEVADLLSKKGFPLDKNEFERILDRHGLSKKIIAGKYKIDTQLSIEELIELVTGTNRESWK